MPRALQRVHPHISCMERPRPCQHQRPLLGGTQPGHEESAQKQAQHSPVQQGLADDRTDGGVIPTRLAPVTVGRQSVVGNRTGSKGGASSACLCTVPSNSASGTKALSAVNGTKPCSALPGAARDGGEAG